MADSTLYHGEETPPTVRKGHGTAALGPSDSTDTGSDIQGGPGLNRDDGLLPPTGTTSDPDVDGAGATAGPDIGDANLGSDSDRFGTGERAAAGRDSTLPTDQLLRDADSDEVIDPESIGDASDAEGATSDELAGGRLADDDDAFEERDHARADGRHLPGEDVDDIPVFDRGGRQDPPRSRGDDRSR